VRGGAGLHANEAGRHSFEELHHLTAARLLPDDDFFGRVDAVNLEYVLGDSKPIVVICMWTAP
jgi:hypothetical protein